MNCLHNLVRYLVRSDRSRAGVHGLQERARCSIRGIERRQLHVASPHLNGNVERAQQMDFGDFYNLVDFGNGVSDQFADLRDSDEKLRVHRLSTLYLFIWLYS